MKPVTVLVTGVGAPGGVTIMKALRYSRLPIYLVSADLNPRSVGLFFSESAYLLPRVTDPSYLDRLASLCRDERVDIAFVGAEPELRFLLAHFMDLEAETGCKFVISRPELTKACMDKWETFVLLKAHGFCCPETALSTDDESVERLVRDFGFPLFVKPRFGSGSKMAVCVRNELELEFFRRYVQEAVVQEFLHEQDEEYTVGVYVNRMGSVVGSIVSKRELASGLTYRAQFDPYPDVAAYCEAIAEALKPLGPCNIQLRRHRNRLSVFEINPRCSSSTVMRSVMGFNEPEMAIRDLVFQERIERPITRCGVVMRYWEEAYVYCPPELPARRDFGAVVLPDAEICSSLMVRRKKEMR